MPPFPELRDITPPPQPGPLEALLERPESIAALLWLALVGLGLMIALVWWLRNRQRKPNFPPLPPTPATAAQRRLEELRTLAPSLPAGELAGAVHESLRSYLHRARGVLARYRTTDELEGATVPGGPPALPFMRAFLPVFRRCDTMRFSASDDRSESRRALIDEALAAVAADDRAIRESPAPPPPAAVPPSAPAPPPLPPPGAPASAGTVGTEPVPPPVSPPLPSSQASIAGFPTQETDHAAPVPC